MCFLTDFFLNPIFIKQWLQDSSVLLKVFWFCFLIFSILSIFYYLIFISFFVKVKSDVFIAEYKRSFERKKYFNLLQLFIAVAVFGFAGIVLYEYFHSESTTLNENNIVRIALIIAFIILVIQILAEYFFYKYNYHPNLVIKHVLDHNGEVVEETPAKKLGFGKIKTSYRELSILFHCVTDDSDKIPKESPVRVLELEDIADTLLITKYF